VAPPNRSNLNKMRLSFIAFLFLLMSGLSALGQTAGTTEQSIVAQYGAPQIERLQNGKKIWIYSNGTRLVIVNGVVETSNVSTTQPPPQRIEDRPLPSPIPASKPTALKPKAQNQSTSSQTTSAYPDTAHPRPEKLHLTGLGTLLVTPGFIVGLVAGIWFIIVTFRQSVLWGLACLFLPFASLIFIIVHWKKAKTPFLLWLLVSIPLVFLGIFFGSA
jgi:hypothetical protein